jgi:hypothetical protein
MRHEPPTEAIDGTPVVVIGAVIKVGGEEWVTLVPEGDDERLWEFSLTTGRMLQVSP